MLKSEFLNIIQSGQIAPYSNYVELSSLANQYPYSSTLQVLKAIAAKQEDRIEQNESLETAAVYIQDRSKLYDYTLKESLNKKILELSDTSEGENKPIEEAEEKNSTDEKEELQNLDIEFRTKTEKRADNPISSKPLEEQIMREAVMHLSEMEAESQLSELPAEQQDISQDKPQVKEVEKEEPKSFGSWLLSLDKKDESASTEIDRGLIDKFIQESPQISPVKAAFFSPSQVGKMSLMEDETFVTETLAKIYEKQGDFKKAARAYKNLILKYPEKSSYFAALQKKAEDQIKK